MNRTIDLLQKFQQVLPRPPLITIYQSFIKLRFVCEMSYLIKLLIFHHYFHHRLESIPYSIALAIPGAISSTSKENESSSYLYHLVTKASPSYSACNYKYVPPVKSNHSFLKNTFFPSTIHPPYRMKQIRFEYSLFSFRNRILQLIILHLDIVFSVPNSLKKIRSWGITQICSF